MSKKGYTPISAFWAVGVPGAVFGLGYYAWHSQGYVAMQVKAALQPIVEPISAFFSSVI